MINNKRAIDLFLNFVSIPSPSLIEDKFREYLHSILIDIADEIITEENNSGKNLLAFFNQKSKNEGIILSAHMDTVEDGVKKIVPYIDGGYIWAKEGSILGADNKSTIAAFIEAIISAIENKKIDRPVLLLLTYGEEKHLDGAKKLDINNLKYKKAILMDAAGEVGGIIKSSPSHYSFTIKVYGKKAHAGIEPEKGENAIVKASKIITKLPDGRLNKNTTFNIGYIHGGEKTNIVPDFVVINGEFRSTSEKYINTILNKIENLKNIFQDISIELKLDYPGYEIDTRSDFVKYIAKKMKETGIKPYFLKSGGGSDANILREYGIEAINLASGMINPHSKEEHISIDSIIKASELIYNILI
ncbi:MAG TPA: M20/M25/M40 family metallo-hydrolase [Spirochaetota bacterium]|nr:M20/M25/M40 family metallo-hydrolase [Spirochaetota bacterium]HOM38815.1 M20/M25/M40 family metallo-hydrolase [Spirochaetota bacterium]HPQ49873.1 M20/M25/M40 family metallo-hydrolase [Spirochaetota bacterium]